MKKPKARGRTIANLSRVAKKSEEIGKSIKELPIYYSISRNAVCTRQTQNNRYVTTLIRPNTGQEIADAINRWLWL